MAVNSPFRKRWGIRAYDGKDPSRTLGGMLRGEKFHFRASAVISMASLNHTAESMGSWIRYRIERLP
jgi:hypothetical protein